MPSEILHVRYTDGYSITAELFLTVTPLGNSVYSVTGVSGNWNGQAITAGPVDNDPRWHGFSDKFYADPSQVPSGTVDSGFLFYTASGYRVRLYQQHYNPPAPPGFAESYADANYQDQHSGALASIQIDPVPVLHVRYTDAMSNTAELFLTVTPLGNSVYSVTGVSGNWNGQAITAGPVDNDPYWGARSDKYYQDPSAVPSGTVDTGFLFYTATGYKVTLYQFNRAPEGPGFATAYTDANNQNYHSGAAYIQNVAVAAS
jgi:hypothetical protein